MKRLFNIGSGLFIFSIVPILSWIVLSYVLGDSRIANVFSITYAIQFIWTIFKVIFASGANIRKEREGDKDAVWNSIFWGSIFAIIIFSIPIIFVDKYIAFFGQDVDFYRDYVIYSIALLFEQVLLSFIIEKLYFEDKEKLANTHLIAFNLTTFVSLILFSAIIPNTKIALAITLGILLIYLIGLFVWQFEKFKISFTFFKNIKYVSGDMVTAVFFMIVYLFGYKNAFQAGAEYIDALNLVALCTDAQWDTLGAFDTVARVDIAKHRYEYKKEMKNAYLFTIIVMLTSIIMTLALTWINGYIITIVLAYLAFQIVGMMLDTYSSILSIYTQIEYSPKTNTIIQFSTLIVRTLISTFLLSPFCTDIGQIVQSVILIIIYFIIRVTRYKVVDGRLTIKNNKDKNLKQEGP